MKHRCKVFLNLAQSLLVVTALLSSTIAAAAIIDLNFVAPLSSAEVIISPPDDQVQFMVSTSDFLVNSGDSVRAKLSFTNNDSFEVLNDPLSLAIGTQAFLTLVDVPDAAGYTAEFGFSFTFLDVTGAPLLSDTAAPVIRSGGDLHGDVTILQQTDLVVGGLLAEFTNITNAGSGGLPVSFNGARFLVHNVSLGAPFVESSVAVPEPSSPRLVVAGLLFLGLVFFRRRASHDIRR